MKHAEETYLFVGLILATVMKIILPSISLLGWLWYGITWPWQLLAAQIQELQIAPTALIPYLFNF